MKFSFITAAITLYSSYLSSVIATDPLNQFIIYQEAALGSSLKIQHENGTDTLISVYKQRTCSNRDSLLEDEKKWKFKDCLDTYYTRGNWGSWQCNDDWWLHSENILDWEKDSMKQCIVQLRPELLRCVLNNAKEGRIEYTYFGQQCMMEYKYSGDHE
ncbi:unnamed protein product [Cunninghamella blakesleeana]